jgi:hypothetical protein
MQFHRVPMKESAHQMFTEWRPIRLFPGYSISSEGFVRNDESGQQMALLVNQHGVVHVGLTRNRVQYKRAVGLLVANAFIPNIHGPAFDCPINLDGDRYNNRVANLTWRPKWFAVKYYQQMEEAHFEDPYPIEEVESHQEFYNPWMAAMAYGILQVDILLSLNRGTKVWPSRKSFARIK